jgi:dolichol-phosphate mannosyltransferase
MYNENGLVKQYCAETTGALSALEERYNFEIILVNDGSKDSTLAEMLSEREKDPKHIAVVNLTRNFGLEGALNAGLEVASGDATVVMDADLQDPPSVILEMVKEWEKGVDVVAAIRAKRVNDTLFKRIGAALFYKALDSFSGKIKIQRGAANYCLLSRHALSVLKGLPESNKVFRVTVPYIGMNTAYVTYTRDKRYTGKTKYNLKNMIPYALDGIAGISILPLRKIPLAFFASSAAFIASSVLAVFKGGLWQAVFLLCAAMSAFFSMLFLCLAIIGEYLAQIMMEAKGRPISLIYSYTPSENGKSKWEGPQ